MKKSSRIRAWVRKLSLLAVAMVLLEVLMAPPSRPAAAYDVCADDNACIHEYMAEQALELYTNNEIDA